MKAIPFPQANKVLKAPPGQEADVYDLPVWGGEVEGIQRCISCWEPTPEERAAIAAGGPVWIWVVGHTHPPLVLDAASPFEPGRTVSRLLPATVISVQLYVAPAGRIIGVYVGMADAPDQAPASGPALIEMDRAESLPAFNAWQPVAGRCVVFEEAGRAQGMFRLASLPTYPVSVLVERVEP